MVTTAQKITFIFNKQRGDSTLIKTWDEFDARQQLFMLEGVQLGPEEVPVVGIAEARSRVIITTKRIAWRSNDTLHDLGLDAIAKVRVPEFFESSKHHLHRLWLVTHEGKEHLLEAEPGEPFFVLWNLLLRIIDQPKPEDSAD